MPIINLQSDGESLLQAAGTAVVPGIAVTRGTEDPSIQQRQAYAGAFRGDTGNTAPRSTVTTKYNLLSAGTGIALHGGISNATWTLPLRASEDSVMGGKVRYAAPRVGFNATSSQTVGASNASPFFDNPVIGLTFNSGNISPMYDKSDNKIMAYGLQDFYAFLELVNQPPVIGGPNAGENSGLPNYFILYYQSRAFPSLTLRGFIDPAGIAFAEDAENQNQVSWTCQMTVWEMTPNIWDSGAMTDMYSLIMDAQTF
jgi:hypothetical protein